MNEWVEFLFTYDEIEAEIVKDLLEAEDIEVFVKSSKVTPYPVSVGNMGEIRLFVNREDREKAEGVLKAVNPGRIPEQDDS